ncbi:MAG TPA: sortase [Clostridia bacterium]|nr:sortase [Clostridia bacterium]
MATRPRPSVRLVALLGAVVLLGAIALGARGMEPLEATPTPSPVAVAADSPAVSPAVAPSATRPVVPAFPSPSWLPSPYDFPTPPPTPRPTRRPDVAAGPTNRVATRVLVPALDIDLPVMRQKTSYPPCNVAMYLPQFKQPGRGGPVYLYAHARDGMFLPLLTRSKRNDGASMIGMTVYVYTGDNLRFRYEITRVRRHARDFRPVTAAKGETIWLQTSEGPNASYPKLQVAGKLIGHSKVSHDEAHPRPRPRSC